MAKRALLIGINRYRIPGADLRGCVNDVQNVKRLLTQYYGFTPGNIKTLTDFQATTKRMQTEIESLVAKSKPGDVVLLHYSGHGSNVPDGDGDEADRRDEILCPTDLDWKAPLTDDWLRKAFDKLPKRVNFTVVFDCCHSGTATRVFLPPDAPVKPRYLPSPWDLVASESGRPLRGAVRNVRGKKRGSSRSRDVVHADIPEFLVTGCRDTQTSADAFIGGSYNGALTYSLAAVIDKSRGKISYRELHAQTVARLKKGRFDQVPQLEGRSPSFDMPFLSAPA